MESTEETAEPRRVLWIGGTGVGLVLLAFAMAGSSAGLDGPRVLLTTIGLIFSGSAISLRPTWRPAWGIGLAAALSAIGGFPNSWDTFQLVAIVLAGLAAFMIVLFSLPMRVRFVVASILVMVHFVGIYTACTLTLDPPWLFSQLWARFYRPYLYFINLNNSYQFFAPDPGSTSDLWFCLEYDTPNREKCFEWVVVPRRSESRDPLFLSYYRRIKIPELASLGYSPGYLLDAEAREVRELRDESPIPRHADLPATRQLFIPNVSIQHLLIPSYVQHVADKHQRLDAPIKSIKVYRVLHEYITPEQFVAAIDGEGKKPRRITPFDPTTFLPYYLGSFDANGVLSTQVDPMRWWLVPIVAKPDANLPPAYLREIKDSDYERSFTDYLKQHAGDDGYRKGP